MAGAVGSVERVVGRYALYGEIASGGMATVHFGRLLGPVGFSRTVAIKRLHPQFAKDPEFVSMFLDEARLAGRIQHPNAVATLDVVALEGELFLVMEYVQGESLARLFRGIRAQRARIPPPIVCSIMTGVLHGLHAAHEARTERGTPLGIVHRDVSPQNIMIGADGVPRVLDFGVAKAAGRVQTTRDGQIKGKLAYMAPEQMRSGAMDRRVDVYAAAVVLWEALTGRQCFAGDNEGVVFAKVLEGGVEPPSRHYPDISPAVDAVVMRGLAREPDDRFATARDMAIALEDALPLASPRQVGEWVERIAGDSLAKRAERVKEIESVSSSMTAPVHPGGGAAHAADPEGNAPTTISDSRSFAAPGSAREHGPPPPIDASSSQVSSISVSRARSTGPVPPGRGRAAVAIAGAVAALVVAIGAVVLLRGGAPSAEAGPAATSQAGGAVTAASPAIATPLPSASAATAATAEATAGAHATGAPSAAKPPPAKAAPRTPAASKPASKPPAPSCSPPYTIDSNGIRRPKPECL